MDQPASRTAPDAAPSGHLKEGLTMIDVVSLGVGSAVGVSIFSIMAPAAKVAGTGMLPALARTRVDPDGHLRGRVRVHGIQVDSRAMESNDASSRRIAGRVPWVLAGLRTLLCVPRTF
jgi:hypothetical protein